MENQDEILEKYKHKERGQTAELGDREDAEFATEVATPGLTGGYLTGPLHPAGNNERDKHPPDVGQTRVTTATNDIPMAERTDGGDRATEMRARGEEGAAVTRGRNAGLAAGWTALVLAILSTILLPGILGTAAVIIGIYALMQGRRALGGWAIIIALLSLVSYWVLLPLYS